ncbi:MAG TPA: CopG family transcriptional regulator [Chloroflexota bacterium]|nr:CopG family transcriptional regulator [Chloroflexota bacterium]
MAQLHVELSDAELAALERCADQRQVSATALIREYLHYLLAGGQPVSGPRDRAPSAPELAALAERGGAFDWLADEPDLYSLADGEPV